jgi:FG-GAP repeat/FG-GAP-like repeat
MNLFPCMPTASQGLLNAPTVQMSASAIQSNLSPDPLAITASQTNSASVLNSSSVFGVRSETWNQGAGGLAGQASNWQKIVISSGKNSTGIYRRGDELGQAVATGDFDGDGYIDLAMSSPGEGATSYSDASGRSYDQLQYNGPGLVQIMYGSSTGLSANRQQYLQIGDTRRFGISLATGDFNRDGRIDLAIGRSNGVTIFSGSRAGLQFTAGLSVSGTPYALAVGDFNGDGADDLAAGSPLASSEAGSVTIFNGALNTGLTLASSYWTQDSPDVLGGAEGAPDRRFNDPRDWGDRFGFSLAAGDFDGDGRDDLAIGVPGERFKMGGISNVPGGAVNVLYGSQSGLTAARNQFWDQNGTENPDRFNLEGGIEANDQFGYDLAAGDFNGDGIADLAIGVPGEDTATGSTSDDSNGGAVAIIYGRRNQGLTNAGNQLIDQNTQRMRGGVEKDDRFGASLEVGDFNYDGYADLAIGVPGETAGSTRGGAVAIVAGLPTGLDPNFNYLVDQDQIQNAKVEDNDQFGAALAFGDFDGNGSDDLAIGAPGEQVGSGIFGNAGEVNVMYGRSYLPTITVLPGEVLLNEGIPGRFSISSGAKEGTLIKLRSFGTAKLGVDFTVNGATVEGDIVTFRMPAPGSERYFGVTVLKDDVREAFESIEFQVIKGNGYQINPNQKARTPIGDASPLRVDTLIDENDGDYSAGDLSLREMIQLSSSGAAISFAPELTGTIVLNSQLLINKNLTINASGANRLNISGNNRSRIFEIASGNNVTLKGMTIRDGFLVNGSGGGIENLGNLTIVDSRITNNKAVYGGGIHSIGSLTVRNSTIDNNIATYDGGGIYIDFGIANLDNLTISGNQANYGAGLYQSSGDITINHATITNNTATTAGSGVYQSRGSSPIKVKNSILADNRTIANPIGDFFGSAWSLGNNLVGVADGSGGFEIDLRGFYRTPLNLKLGLLQDNGGTTLTHALPAGSLAIDAASLDDMSTDQRGTAVQSGRRDIGAFEWVSPLNIGISEAPTPLVSNSNGEKLPKKKSLLPIDNLLIVGLRD